MTLIQVHDFSTETLSRNRFRRVCVCAFFCLCLLSIESPDFCFVFVFLFIYLFIDRFLFLCVRIFMDLRRLYETKYFSIVAWFAFYESVIPIALPKRNECTINKGPFGFVHLRFCQSDLLLIVLFCCFPSHFSFVRLNCWLCFNFIRFVAAESCYSNFPETKQSAIESVIFNDFNCC